MKTTLRALVLALFLIAAVLPPAPASAVNGCVGPCHLVYDAITATPADDSAATINMAAGIKYRWRGWSPSGASNANAVIYMRASDNEPWYPLTSYANVGSPGFYYNVPWGFQTKVAVTISSGDFSLEYEIKKQ